MTAPNETKQEKKKTKRKENDSGFNTHVHMRFYEIWSIDTSCHGLFPTYVGLSTV